MDFKVIILDFDGVIVESVGIKDRAFGTLFESYPQHRKRIQQYHLRHNAVIRFEKFRHITEDILHLPNAQTQQAKLAQRYSQIVVKEIIACPLVAGVIEFLEEFSQDTPLYLASMNPQEELEHILRVRKLRSYFQKIYAYPWKKTEAIAQIKEQTAVASDKIIFIGDSPEDYDAAQSVEIPFIGRDSGKSFPAAVDIFKDFYAIREHLSKEPFNAGLSR